MKMISRRQIIASGQPVGNEQQQQQAASSSSSSSNATKPSGRTSNKLAPGAGQQSGAMSKQQATNKMGKMSAANNHNNNNNIKSSPGKKTNGNKQQLAAGQQQGSEDYARSNRFHEDYQQLEERAHWGAQQRAKNNEQQASEQLDANYRHFDPYSIYSDEEDVWYSEERLFEDHLEEIYNKWPFLDDDIWCKLIIMERNRRIGKAYARVPIVTIDGSHELSYDGYKLAINGFDNPDRDDETEECRKRLGKGIRIKMDNFGNILIKRLSKSGVHVKEWINPSAPASGGSSNSTNGSSGAGVGRSMPSRRQLIKAASMSAGVGAAGSSNGGASCASSAGSSMEAPNDSAICDEIIHIGGHLNLDKIYVMFDMKRFQANIMQELCRPFPDRRKLEQQCFSIVGLARDSDDILNLPCWVMVINIVAIEMLIERFPLGQSQHRADHPLADFGLDTRRSERHQLQLQLQQQQQAPSFVSIFEQTAAAAAAGGARTKAASNKEEDPYSMPANASSSDVKSSINDYGVSPAPTKSGPTNCMEERANAAARFYGPPKDVHGPACRQASARHAAELPLMRPRSKSHYNIYGQLASGARPNQAARVYGASGGYGNSSSIYSPGHMLVQPPLLADHSVPPKLPPRDFVAKRAKSKSSTNVSAPFETGATTMQQQQQQDENIYSTRDELKAAANLNELAKVARKSKKNRFLESLKAPLELAKSGRSSSVLGASSAQQVQQPLHQEGKAIEATKKSSSKSGKGGFAKARNLRSLLGVGAKSAPSAKDSASDDSAYVQLEGATEADSAVDPNEELEDSQRIATNSTSSPAASYNDLDIPTPDYETDENIYALNHGSNANGSQNNNNNNNNNNDEIYDTGAGNRSKQRGRLRGQAQGGKKEPKSTKDDLYYSGLMAHVPHAIGQHAHDSQYMKMGGERRRSRARANGAPVCDDRMSCVGGSTTHMSPNSRYLMRTSRMLAAKMGGRDNIYGSTFALYQQPHQHQQQQQQHPHQTMSGARYRSSSMQRHYPATMRSSGQLGRPMARDYDDYPPHLYYGQQQHRLRANRSHTEIAFETAHFEDPYAMTGASSTIPLEEHYRATTTASCCGGGVGVGRRRSVSKGTPPSVARSMAPSLMKPTTSHYDMGRSSSGIYGNNSSSSSSEYADWHPRKLNSSGYLNSIFKDHKLASSAISAPAPAQTKPSSAHLNNDNSASADSMINNNNNNNIGQQANKKGAQVRNGQVGARGLKTIQQTPTEVDSRPVDAGDATNHKQQEQRTTDALNSRPAEYRSYDSSNDSDPSYTNSSDGLDIYDQIGAQSGRSHAHPHAHPHLHHGHFLEHQLAPEVHVGEWENLYDR